MTFGKARGIPETRNLKSPKLTRSQYLKLNKSLKPAKKWLDASEITAAESFAKLKVKVPLNFPIEQRKRLSEMVRNTSMKRNLVAKYLANIDEEVRILDLKEFIQQNYCRLRNTNNHEAPLNDIKVIEELSLQLLPENRLLNPHYQANAKAIILHFFEFCYIGAKTEKENQQKPLFD